MKCKWMLPVLILALVLSLAACGGGEETTLTGMVVAVDGTIISVMEMDGEMTGMEFAPGERPEGLEGFDPENFNPENFGGEGFNPEDFAGEGFNPKEFAGEGFDPENFSGAFPGGQMPQDGSVPQMPEGGQMHDFSSGERPSFDGTAFAGETRQLDIANAHISIEIEGGKESGSLEDVTPGTFVTLTIDGKGNVTYVLITSTTGFGGRFM